MANWLQKHREVIVLHVRSNEDKNFNQCRQMMVDLLKELPGIVTHPTIDGSTTEWPTLHFLYMAGFKTILLRYGPIIEDNIFYPDSNLLINTYWYTKSDNPTTAVNKVVNEIDSWDTDVNNKLIMVNPYSTLDALDAVKNSYDTDNPRNEAYKSNALLDK
eukprot:1883547-Ditylum_brightwellii.AAC.1